jgi:peptidoglycan/xylan/chitin deacetylase (PgdA/CDA1 family)
LLTFDDGPHPDVTPAVLDRLQAFRARAVFFVVGGRVGGAAHLLAEIQGRGHRIGNHTFHHKDSYVTGADGEPRFLDYYQDSRRCQHLVESHTGARPKLFRPPGGRLTPVTLAVPRSLGMRCVAWSRDIGDWQFRTAAEACAGAEELARQIVARDIVLLHDDNPCVVDVLDALLPSLAARGYDLSSGLDDL